MKNQKTFVSYFAMFFLILVMLLALYGCHEKPKTLPPTYGRIMVDKPEVFTRERLILRRHQDIQWLEAKLQEKLQFGFQGMQDVRLLSEMMTELNANYNPMQGKIDTATVQNQLNELKIQSLRQELSTLQQQAKITEALKKISEGETLSEEEDGETEDLDQSKLNQLKAALEKKIDDKFDELNETIKDITSQNTPQNTGSLREPKPEVSGARPTGIELLRDELAYREAIQAALREKELDDSHDLVGKTVYTFKFDITVQPGENTLSFAKINLELMNQNDKNITDEFFEKWKEHIQDYVQKEAISLQKRWDKRQLTNLEKIALAQELDE